MDLYVRVKTMQLLEETGKHDHNPTLGKYFLIRHKIFDT